MAGNLSDYTKNQLRTHLFRTGSFTKPTALYYCLLTAAPTDSSTGSTITEPSGNGYARINLAPLDANYSAEATAGQTKNQTALTWTASGGSWGTITHMAVVDASSAGNLLYWAAVTNKTIGDGDSYQLPVAGHSFSFD